VTEDDSAGDIIVAQGRSFSAALLVNQTTSNNAELAHGTIVLSSVLVPEPPTAQPVPPASQSLLRPAVAQDTNVTVAPSTTDLPTLPAAAADSFFAEWDWSLK
jgi:hypothetical protein